MLRPICRARAENGPTYVSSSLISPVSGSRVNPCSASAETELRIAHDGGVADAVDGLDAVAHADRVQTSPLAVGPDAGVDLEVQMPVRVTGSGRVVPDGHGLEPLDRHLHLSTPRTHPRRGVLGQPPHDLYRGSIHRRVVRLGQLRVKGGGQGPRLGTVHDDLAEPDGLRIGPQPPTRFAAQRIETRHPGLVAVPIESAGLLDAVGGGDEPLARPVPSAR